MGLFEDRLRKRLEDQEFALAYQESNAEIREALRTLAIKVTNVEGPALLNLGSTSGHIYMTRQPLGRSSWQGVESPA